MAPAMSNPLLSDRVARSKKVPSSHVRAVGDRPDLANVDHESGAGIPLIDLKQLEERREVRNTKRTLLPPPTTMDLSGAFTRGRKPAKPGTGASDMAKAVARTPAPQKVIIELQHRGPSKQVLEGRPARGISGPLNRFEILAGLGENAAAEGGNIRGEDDDGEGAAEVDEYVVHDAAAAAEGGAAPLA